MLTNFESAAISAAFVSACFLYHYEVCKPIEEEHHTNLRDDWIDFIHANIISAYTLYHCLQCRKMISLFETRFKKETPPYLFNNYVELLNKWLDTRQKIISTEESPLGDLTSSDVEKFFQ